MSMRPGKPSSIEGIKRLAKQIKTEKGLQHARALDEAAVMAGFQNFTHAKRVMASKGQQAPGRREPPSQPQQKVTTMPTRSDFHIRARADWVSSIESVTGPRSSSSVTWRGPNAIAAALEPIMGSNRNHTHLPGGGGYDFESVDVSPEPGCLDFSIGGSVVYRLKPRQLILEWIESDPAESFFLLELDELAPSGVYPERAPREGEEDVWPGEELCELYPGSEYYPRRVWDNDETPDGRELPSSARLVVRWLWGKCMFVTKGSIWNGWRAAYDGRHGKMTAAQIRGIIEQVIHARAERA